MAATACKYRNDRFGRSLKRPGCEFVECCHVDLWMIARLQNHICTGVNVVCSAKPGSNRFEHRQLRVALSQGVTPCGECRGNSRFIMTEDDNHVVANRTDAVVRRADKRFASA